MTPECKTCKWWNNPYGGWENQCRRHAPAYFRADPVSMQGRNCDQPVWPVTSENDWCGDYEPKVEPEVEVKSA